MLVELAPSDSFFWVPGILGTHTGRITRLSSDPTGAGSLSWMPDGGIVANRGRFRSALWRFQRAGK
jgi:hypothetical protein